MIQISIHYYHACTSLFSFAENILKHSLSNAEFKQFSGGNTPGPPFWWKGREERGKFVFVLREYVLNLSHNNAELTIFPAITPSDPRFMDIKFVLVLGRLWPVMSWHRRCHRRRHRRCHRCCHHRYDGFIVDGGFIAGAWSYTYASNHLLAYYIQNHEIIYTL